MPTRKRTTLKRSTLTCSSSFLERVLFCLSFQSFGCIFSENELIRQLIILSFMQYLIREMIGLYLIIARLEGKVDEIQYHSFPAGNAQFRFALCDGFWLSFQDYISANQHHFHRCRCIDLSFGSEQGKSDFIIKENCSTNFECIIQVWKCWTHCQFLFSACQFKRPIYHCTIY